MKQKILVAYISFFLLLLYVHFFRLPIFAGDTDLWYHLSSGRFIVESLKIPKESYFSFLDPPREWVDYYWLFQVLVYCVYRLGHYHGLVILRALLFLLVTIILFLFLFSEEKDGERYPFRSIFFLFLVLLLLPRYALLRPHTFSYLLLATFLYILEKKKGYVKYLPAIGLVWSNIHGIEYPIMIFIVVCYLFDFMLEKRREGTGVEKKDLPFVSFLLLSAITPFFTPQFFNLMVIPFIPITFARHYIRELAPFSLLDLTSLKVENFLVSFETVVLLLLFFTLLSFLYGIAKRVFKARHIILLLCAIVLLSMGKRFAYESFLLLVPFIYVSSPSISFQRMIKDPSKLLAFSFFIILLFLPLLDVKKRMGVSIRYPFSFENLPHGVSIFLNEIGARGYVLNHPNVGGYLEWMLYPKYKIFMDMQVPFLFTNEDMFVAIRIFSFLDENILKDFLEKYDPSFIVAPISVHGFNGLMEKFPHFKKVFFDDFYVLYANSIHYPELVNKFELKKVDPYNLRDLPLLEKESELVKNELERIHNFHPHCALANEYLARFYIKRGLYQKALKFAERIIEAYPGSPKGYTLKAEILKEMKRYRRAIVYYKKSIKLRETKDNVFALGKVFFEMGEYGRAYELMVKAINLFSLETNHRDVYYAATAAFHAKKAKEACVLFKYGLMMLPKDDREYVEKYKELILHLSKCPQENTQPGDFPFRKAKEPH